MLSLIFHSSHQKSKLTSFILCCSLLHKNVPNRQLYRWSRMVTRKYSLNSNAAGNLNKNSFISVLERPCYSEEIPTYQCHLLLTCLVNCQTQSTNWIKTGERSASVWFLSPWPIRLKKWQKSGQSVMKLDRPPHLKGRLKCQKCTNVGLPAGSGDRSSATLSQAAPRSREWCGSNHPAWAWPRRWAGLCGPNRRYSAPPPRFSQTLPCLRSAVLLLGSATNTRNLVKRLFSPPPHSSPRSQSH